MRHSPTNSPPIQAAILPPPGPIKNRMNRKDAKNAKEKHGEKRKKN
jgi:hypothetical protein